MSKYAIVIDNELIEFDDLFFGGYLHNLSLGRRDWYIAENKDRAMYAAKEVYKDMDSDELVAMVGADKIVLSWSTGETFDEWLDDNITPEGEFASYDGDELDVTSIEDYLANLNEEMDEDEADVLVEAWDNLCSELGFTPTVAYRHN